MTKPDLPKSTDKDVAEFIRSACFTGDTEADHVNADIAIKGLLAQLGYVETLEAYDDVAKFYA